MNLKKINLLTICYVAIFCSLILSVYAYWITSNIVTVTVGENILVLSPESLQVEINDNATITAYLTNGEVPVEGATIYLYNQDDVLQYTNTTLADGTCTFTVTMDTLGTFDFYAEYEVS